MLLLISNSENSCLTDDFVMSTIQMIAKFVFAWSDIEVSGSKSGYPTKYNTSTPSSHHVLVSLI